MSKTTEFVLTAEMLTLVRKLSGQGMTIDQIANYFMVKPDLFTVTMKRKPELREAVVMGRSKAIAFVSGKLFEHCKKGNLTAIIFYLKTRGEYSEKQLIGIGADPSSPAPLKMKIETTDPIEAGKIYQQFIKGS